MITFPCTKCKQILEGEEADIGLEATCPHCGQDVAIPPTSTAPAAPAPVPAPVLTAKPKAMGTPMPRATAAPQVPRATAAPQATRPTAAPAAGQPKKGLDALAKAGAPTPQPASAPATNPAAFPKPHLPAGTTPRPQATVTPPAATAQPAAQPAPAAAPAKNVINLLPKAGQAAAPAAGVSATPAPKAVPAAFPTGVKMPTPAPKAGPAAFPTGVKMPTPMPKAAAAVPGVRPIARAPGVAAGGSVSAGGRQPSRTIATKQGYERHLMWGIPAALALLAAIYFGVGYFRSGPQRPAVDSRQFEQLSSSELLQRLGDPAPPPPKIIPPEPAQPVPAEPQPAGADAGAGAEPAPEAEPGE